MKKKSLFSNILFYFSIIFVLFLIWKILLPFADVITVNSESMYMPYLAQDPQMSVDGVAQVFNSSDHSWYILSVFHVLNQRYLPEILNMHPQSTINIVSRTFLFFIFYCLLFALSNSFYKYGKKSYLYPVFLFTTFIIVCELLAKSQFIWVFLNDCWYYAYILLPIFALVFYNNVAYNYVTQKRPSKKEFIIIVLLAICVGVSHEFFRFVYVSTLFIGYFADRIIIKKCDFSGFWKYVLLFFGYFVINVMSALTVVYESWFLQRFSSKTLADYIHYLPEYWKYYKTNVIDENFILYIAIIAVCILIAIFVKKRETNKRFYICVSSCILSIFLFMFAIIVGESEYGLHAMVEHSGIRFLAKLLLINIVFSGFGYLIFNVEKQQQFFKWIYALGMVFVSYLLISFGVIKFDSMTSWGKELRINLYIWEKLFVLKNAENNSNNNIYYYYNRDGITVYSLYYLIETYDLPYEFDDYKKVAVCKISDSVLACRAKMKKLIYEETGYKFTQAELQDTDFDKLYEIYQKNLKND